MAETTLENMAVGEPGRNKGSKLPPTDLSLDDVGFVLMS